MKTCANKNNENEMKELKSKLKSALWQVKQYKQLFEQIVSVDNKIINTT